MTTSKILAPNNLILNGDFLQKFEHWATPDISLIKWAKTPNGSPAIKLSPGVHIEQLVKKKRCTDLLP